MRAGVGVSVITPPLPVQLAGHRGRRVATYIRDHLKAKSIVFEDRDRLVAIVSVDLLWLDRGHVAAVRAIIEEVTGINACNVLVACTHTHSGPDTLDWYDFAPRVDTQWLQALFRQIASSTYIAANALEEVKCKHDMTSVEIGISRRLPTAGGVERHPNREGFVDHSLDVLSVMRVDGSTLGTLIRHSTHPVILGANSLCVSRDWCGSTCDMVESEVGGVCLYFSGASGDVNPIGWTNSTVAELDRVGRQVGAAAIECVLRKGTVFDFSVYRLSNELELEGFAHPYLKRAQEARIARDGCMKVEVQAIRLGPCTWVGMPGECLGETAQAIAFGNEHTRTLPISYANDYVGYLPTRKVIDEGGYEARTRMLSVEGIEKLVETAVTLVKQISEVPA